MMMDSYPPNYILGSIDRYLKNMKGQKKMLDIVSFVF